MLFYRFPSRNKIIHQYLSSYQKCVVHFFITIPKSNEADIYSYIIYSYVTHQTVVAKISDSSIHDISSKFEINSSKLLWNNQNQCIIVYTMRWQFLSKVRCESKKNNSNRYLVDISINTHYKTPTHHSINLDVLINKFLDSQKFMKFFFSIFFNNS